MFDRSMNRASAMTAWTLGILLALSVTVPSHAQEAAAQVPPELLELQDRLELTDEQKAKAGPVFAESARKRRELMEEKGVTRETQPQMSRSQRASMGRAMREVRKETQKQLAKILTPEQMLEYRKIQEEVRERRRQQFDRGAR